MDDSLIQRLERALMAGATPVLAYKSGEFSVGMPFQGDLDGRATRLAEAMNVFLLKVDAFMAEIEAMPRD